MAGHHYIRYTVHRNIIFLIILSVFVYFTFARKTKSVSPLPSPTHDNDVDTGDNRKTDLPTDTPPEGDSEKAGVKWYVWLLVLLAAVIVVAIRIRRRLEYSVDKALVDLMDARKKLEREQYERKWETPLNERLSKIGQDTYQEFMVKTKGKSLTSKKKWIENEFEKDRQVSPEAKVVYTEDRFRGYRRYQ